MAVSGSDYGVKRARENSEFPFDCSKPKYKRRKVSARRDFPKGLVQFVSEPEEFEAMESGNPVGFSAKSNHVVKVEMEESESEPEELEAVESDYDDVLSEPIHEVPERIPVARKVYARRDFPEAFYANSSHFVKVDREESESEPEELETIDSDDDPEAFRANATHFVKVDREESESDPEELETIDSDDDPEASRANATHFVKVDREESESDPEELEAIDSDDDDPEGYFASCSDFMMIPRPEELEAMDYDNDDPKVFCANSSHFVKADREESESDPEELEAIDSNDDPGPFRANSSHFVKMDREESESDPEELEAIDSDVAEVEKTERNCELEEIDGSSNAKPICSADKMEPKTPKDKQNQEPVNHVVCSTEPLDSSRTRGAGEKRGDYLQHFLASLDQLADTLMQMKKQGLFKKKVSAD